MSKKLDDIIDKALKNIEQDPKDESRHRDIGLTLAKYVETLQRSNEQIVKVATLIQKEQKKTDGLTEQDMETIFSKIAEE